jgi:serine/threonine-protein kinase
VLLMAPMEAKKIDPGRSGPRIDWESFYVNYRKPGYVPGFEIVNKLGGGVFGLVFKARKESIGKDYAIKFLKVDDEVVRDAVVREIDAVKYFAQIDHPNLVSIEDKGEVDGIPFIVMSYAGEGTLRKLLDGGALPREQALRIFVQAARGVQALHEHSLVHFDLKPANIFLRGEVARVGDYGLSKLVTESRNSLSFGRGTPYYMAPEMLKRRGDHRSDIYSLGVMLYECLTGDVPFRGDSEWEVLHKHETEPVQVPATVGPAERRVIQRCLAKRPEERYQSVTEILQELQAPAALGDSLVIPPAATPVGSPPGMTPVEGSPYGMPWQREEPAPGAGGPVAQVVGAVFRAIEFAIVVLIAPIRVLGIALGRLVVFAVRLPFRALGLLAVLLGYVAVGLVLLLVLYTVAWVIRAAV